MAVGLSGCTLLPLMYSPIGSTIGLDLVQVKPLGPPSMTLHYMDFKYDDIMEKRKLKLDKIIEKMKERQNGNINEYTTGTFRHD